MNYSSSDNTWQPFPDTDNIPKLPSQQPIQLSNTANSWGDADLHLPGSLQQGERKSKPLEEEPAFPRALRFFSPNSKERRAAIQALISSGKEVCLDAMPMLQQALRDEAESVRMAAVEAFGILGEHIAAEVLLYSLNDASWSVRAAAAFALGNIRGCVPVKYLVDQLEREEDESVREAIIHAIGRQPELLPVPLIREVLCTDESWLVREAAAWVLGELGGGIPTRSLIAALKSDPDEYVRATAAKSLGKCRTPEAEEPLLQALLDDDEDVREAAGWALQQFDDEIRGRHRGNVYHFHLSEAHGNPFPIETQSTLEQALLTLAQFISDKKGFVKTIDHIESHQGQTVLLMDCFYQTSGNAPQKSILRSLRHAQLVEPLESALTSRDTVVQFAARRAVEAQQNRPAEDVFIVSCVFSPPPERAKQNRIIVAGLGCKQVRERDSCVLDQLVDTWMGRMEEPLDYEDFQKVEELKVWYHPASHPLNLEYAAN